MNSKENAFSAQPASAQPLSHVSYGATGKASVRVDLSTDPQFPALPDLIDQEATNHDCLRDVYDRACSILAHIKDGEPSPPAARGEFILPSSPMGKIAAFQSASAERINEILVVINLIDSVLFSPRR